MEWDADIIQEVGGTFCQEDGMGRQQLAIRGERVFNDSRVLIV